MEIQERYHKKCCLILIGALKVSCPVSYMLQVMQIPTEFPTFLMPTANTACTMSQTDDTPHAQIQKILPNFDNVFFFIYSL